MKKILSSMLALGMTLLFSCRDESLNPIPGWEPGVHALAVFASVPEGAAGSSNKANFTNNAVNFPRTGQDASKIDFKIRWVSLDNKLKVNRVEVLVEMSESYTDPDGNPRTANLGKKLAKTINPAAGNRQWSTFSITPDEVYNLFKDATVKYNRVNDVRVFENPANPRPAGARLKTTDRFTITWRLYTENGLRFDTWNPDSICGDPTPVSEANSNCSLSWTVR